MKLTVCSILATWWLASIAATAATGQEVEGNPAIRDLIQRLKSLPSGYRYPAHDLRGTGGLPVVGEVGPSSLAAVHSSDWDREMRRRQDGHDDAGYNPVDLPDEDARPFRPSPQIFTHAGSSRALAPPTWPNRHLPPLSKPNHLPIRSRSRALPRVVAEHHGHHPPYPASSRSDPYSGSRARSIVGRPQRGHNSPVGRRTPYGQSRPRRIFERLQTSQSEFIPARSRADRPQEHLIKTAKIQVPPKKKAAAIISHVKNTRFRPPNKIYKGFQPTFRGSEPFDESELYKKRPVDERKEANIKPNVPSRGTDKGFGKQKRKKSKKGQSKAPSPPPAPAFTASVSSFNSNNTFEEDIFKEKSSNENGFMAEFPPLGFPESLADFGISWEPARFKRRRRRSAEAAASGSDEPAQGRNLPSAVPGFWEEFTFDHEFFHGGTPGFGGHHRPSSGRVSGDVTGYNVARKSSRPTSRPRDTSGRFFGVADVSKFNEPRAQNNNGFFGDYNTNIYSDANYPTSSYNYPSVVQKPYNNFKKKYEYSDKPGFGSTSTSSSNSFFSSSTTDNEILGSGNFAIIKGGTFHDPNDYYYNTYRNNPKPSYKGQFHNFRDFADIKKSNGIGDEYYQ